KRWKKLADLGYSTQSRDADLAIRAQIFKAPSVVPRNADNDAYDFSEELEKDLVDLGYSTQSRDADLAIRAQRLKAPSVVPRDADNADDAYDFSEELEKDLGDLGYSTQSMDADLAIIYADEADDIIEDMGKQLGDDSDDFLEHMRKQKGYDLGIRTGEFFHSDADEFIEHMEKQVGDDSDDADDFLEHMRKQEGYDLGIRTQEFFRSDADEFIEHMEKQVGDDSDDFIEHMRKQVGDDLGIKTRSFFQQVGHMGCVIGGIKFVDRHLNVTDCTQFTVANIPLDVDGITVTNISAKFILLVEKIDLAKHLRASRFYSQFPCVIRRQLWVEALDFLQKILVYALNKGRTRDIKLASCLFF
ncbi:DNA topoisomerase 6 subunit A, partial [Tanacetum coccineum]